MRLFLINTYCEKCQWHLDKSSKSSLTQWFRYASVFTNFLHLPRSCRDPAALINAQAQYSLLRASFRLLFPFSQLSFLIDKILCWKPAACLPRVCRVLPCVRVTHLFIVKGQCNLNIWILEFSAKKLRKLNSRKCHSNSIHRLLYGCTLGAQRVPATS